MVELGKTLEVRINLFPPKNLKEKRTHRTSGIKFITHKLLQIQTKQLPLQCTIKVVHVRLTIKKM